MPWYCGTYSAVGDCPFTSGAAASAYSTEVTTVADIYAEAADAHLSPWAGHFVNDSATFPLLYFSSPLLANWSLMSGMDAGRHLNDGDSRRTADTTSSTLNRDEGALTMDVNTVVELYIIGALILFGLLGNIASIVVLRRYRERRDALFLLQALAVADGLYLAVAGIRYPLKYVLTPGTRNADKYVEMQPIVFPLLKTFQVRIYDVIFSIFLCPCSGFNKLARFVPRSKQLSFSLGWYCWGFLSTID